MNELDKLIHRYISEAKHKLVWNDEPGIRNVLYIVPSKRDSLIEAVKKIESGQIFRDLVKLTREKYEDDEVFENYYCMKHYIDKFSTWQSLVQNFFRRSGFYLNCFNNANVNETDLCKKYHEAFQKKYLNIRYLAPLGDVGFPGYNCIDFGSFKIRRFAEGELYQIINNSVNEVFYPQSVWNIEELSLYWFIEILVKKDIRLVQNRYHYKYDLELMRNPIDYPEEVNFVVYNLLLYDWDKPFSLEYVWEEGDRWDGFKIPFVTEIDDNLLENPLWARDITNLGGMPDEEGTAKFTLSSEETIVFKDYVQKNQELMDKKLFNMWPFMITAFDYLKKAFFTESFPNASEQLLWHITSIEALLGEPKKGVTQLLFKRLSYILSKTKAERSRIRDDFEKIYAIRCDLVHGNPWKDGLSYKYLQDARNLAREACLWFLYFLGIYKNIISDEEDIPNRNDILIFIDLYGLGKYSISSIKLLLEHAPNNISLKNLI